MPKKETFKLLGTFPMPAGLFNKGTSYMRVFAFVFQDSLRQGYTMATNREIAFATGLAPAHVSVVLNKLSKTGYLLINKHPYEANLRIIRIVPHVLYRILAETKLLLYKSGHLPNVDSQSS